MTPLGLDLSLTATGIVSAHEMGTYSPRTKGMERLRDVRDEVLRVVVGSLQTAQQKPSATVRDVLVLIEGYSFRSSDPHAHALGELGGVVRLALFDSGVPYVDIPPASLKKFATGKGNANKEAMLLAAARAGADVSNNNEADAWWLWQMGLMRLELPGHVEATAYRCEAIEKVQWPDSLRAAS